MRHISSKTPAVRRGMWARLLAVLSAVAMLAVLCPTEAIPARAATEGVLRRTSGTNGLVVNTSVVSTKKVRTVKFQNSIPEGDGCWNAGGGNSGTGLNGADDSVRACATVSAEDNTMYDVVYGAKDVYPKFPDEFVLPVRGQLHYAQIRQSCLYRESRQD